MSLETQTRGSCRHRCDVVTDPEVRADIGGMTGEPAVLETGARAGGARSPDVSGGRSS